MTAPVTRHEIAKVLLLDETIERALEAIDADLRAPFLLALQRVPAACHPRGCATSSHEQTNKLHSGHHLGYSAPAVGMRRPIVDERSNKGDGVKRFRGFTRQACRSPPLRSGT
jgi:hypothetical protein